MTIKDAILKQFSMRHPDPLIFVRSQWQKSLEINPYYMIFRWFVALYFLVTWLISAAEIENIEKCIAYKIKWPIYLTHWSYTMCAAETLLSGVMTGAIFFLESEKAITKLYRLYWALTTIATDAAFIVTIVYWIIVYDSSVGLSGYNLVVHAFNSVTMFLDLLIVAQPVRIFHVYWCLGYGFVYTLFTVIYFLAGGTSREGTHYIYAILDWKQPGYTLLYICGVIFMMVLTHMVSYAVFRMRRAIHAALHSDVKEQDEDA